MTEYIEREALETALNHRLNFLMAENGEYDHYTSGFDEAVTRVEDFPSADVATVRHGRWISKNPHGYAWTFVCSNCGYVDGYPFNDRHNYCPDCGAKMYGDRKEGADNG